MRGLHVVGVCKDCKLSQAAREKAFQDRKSRRGEVEGTGMLGLETEKLSELDGADLEHSKTCCMQQVLSLQEDFFTEKLLLQHIIEKAGHKCLFLPKFHCELNPIEMVWGLISVLLC